MAALIGVCLVLALWMSGSRPAAGPLTGSPDPGLLWDQAYSDIAAQALRYRKSGDLRSAGTAYRRGFAEALARGDRLAAVRFQISVGGCHLGLSEYRAALAAFLDARKRANDIGDHTDLGAIAGNLSSVYLQMWDVPAALRAAEEGLTIGRANPSAYFMPPLLLQLGRLYALRHDSRAESFFMEGIEAARQSRIGATPNPQTEARGWDWLGDEQMAREALPDAEKSYLEAYRLRIFSKSAELGFSYGRLGALRLAQHRFEEAGRFTRLAREAVREGGRGWPEYLMKHQEGSVSLARGDVPAALLDFSQAMKATLDWRLKVLPSRSSLAAVNQGLEERIYRSFIELAVQQSVHTHDPQWAARAFQALEWNRAASLRQSLALAGVWREKLPADYWETLGQLDAQEAKALSTSNPADDVSILRLKLTEMEAGTGIGFAVKKDENFRIQTSLNHFQSGLGKSELFLSFLLGRDSSYLWAITRESVNLYRLPPEGQIAAEAEAFRKEILEGSAKDSEIGERPDRRLYEDLFGSLNGAESAKKDWLLSLEDALFEVPFAALVESRDGPPVYLVERHSIQIVPGALSLNKPAIPPVKGGLFLGVGDPIYNTADARWNSAYGGSAFGRGVPAQLVRLVASGDEIQASAASWQKNFGTATLLEGVRADRDTFLDQLARAPRVIHLATHVLFPEADLSEPRREQSLLAFSMTPATANQGPLYLSTTRIATLHVPGALVVMTGCATGTGDIRPGAGLLGLTRAWLMAGAAGVLSTSWPVEDSSGEIFSRFYGYFPEMPAAEALRRSQVDMLRHVPPSQWASYQLTGGLH